MVGLGASSRRVDFHCGAMATLEECDREQARHRKMSDMLAKVETKTPYVAWRCLPDTIDPRGPKGTK